MVEPLQYLLHQCLPDALALVGGEHFQQRNERAEHTIGDRGHESHHLAGGRVDSEHDMVAAF